MTDDDTSDEEWEVILYGLRRIAGNLFALACVIFVGCCFDNIILGLLVWLFLYPLRSNAGGYHAETQIGCKIISVLLLIMAFLEANLTANMTYAQIAVILICMFVIWIFAPVGTANKELDELEHRVYRRRTREILLTEALLAVVGVLCRFSEVVMSIEMAFTISAISILAGKIKNCMYSLSRK